MSENKKTSYIIILGILILGIFTYVAVLNIFDDNISTNPFFSKTETNSNTKIENLEIINNKLVITTSQDTKNVCIKTTKTEPKPNSVCWLKVENNQVTTSIYNYKTYYIWLKDSNNNISEPTKYTS